MISYSWSKGVMMSQSTRFRLAAIAALAILTAVLVPTAALAQSNTTKRPIADFTSTQGTFCGSLPNANCPNFVTTYVAWSGPSTPAPTRLAAVDFAAKETLVTGPG